MSQTENQQREEPAYIPHETALKEWPQQYWKKPEIQMLSYKSLPIS
jgi:hypothetical protein